MEKQFNPDLVYSIGFPSYIFFKKPEVGRYTNPWEINREPLPWHTISGRKNKIRIKLGIWYRILWARRANYIETQTDAAKEGIATRVRFPKNRIKVIPNSPNSLFIEAGQQLKESNFFEKKDSIVFCLSAGYRHKNLDIIPDVAQEIVKRIGNCPLFILTLPNDSIVWNIIKEKATDTGTLSYIQNIGPIKLKTCIEYYQKARIVFLPTLLEVFSATYVEAMAMKVPIVTTDLDFAHDNCKQAAVYFEKENPVDAADKILALMTDSSLYNQKIREGLEVLNEYPTITEKYDQLFDWFQTIISGNEK
ncbi:MAG: glycosyltransferase [Saprospiraceae bacterium]|nr:glycosyltransferase [Saprospiraceae bacterium]